MDISNFDHVSGLIRELRERESELDGLSRTVGDKWIGVTFQGRYQDAEICDVVRPVVIEVLRQRIAVIKRGLYGYGVKTE